MRSHEVTHGHRSKQVNRQINKHRKVNWQPLADSDRRISTYNRKYRRTDASSWVCLRINREIETHLRAHKYTHGHARIQTYTHTHTRAHTHIHTHKPTYALINKLKHTEEFTRTRTLTHSYMHTHTPPHTHLDTPTHYWRNWNTLKSSRAHARTQTHTRIHLPTHTHTHRHAHGRTQWNPQTIRKSMHIDTYKVIHVRLYVVIISCRGTIRLASAREHTPLRRMTRTIIFSRKVTLSFSWEWTLLE